MRIIQLTPGTGNFYCGTCLHDNAAVKALRARGHDALMVPLYLPHVIDEPPASEGVPIFLSGIKVFLEERFPSFRHAPRWLDRALSSPGLLRFASRFTGMTSAKNLGESTISMLRGEHGCQAGEMDRLVEWLRTQSPPDVICLSNSLLGGLAAKLKREFGVPIVCSLQGEDSFLDALPEPYRTQAWELLGGRCRDIDHFIAISRYFGDQMKARLGLPGDRITVIHPGINSADYGPPSPPAGPPAVGYLGRLHHAKGLDVFVDAFIQLKRKNTFPGLRMCAAGAMTGADGKYVEEQRRKLHAASCSGDAEFLPNIDRAQKIDFLSRLSVLSTPATYGEAFGYYVLEAQASGVPVVQPRIGAFPEFIDITGGGILCEPGSPASLAAAIEELLLDPDRARRLGGAGRLAAGEYFGMSAMTDKLESLFTSVAKGGS